MSYRYKSEGVWLSKVEPWEIRAWREKGNQGYPPDHIVDCIIDGSMMAVAYKDYEILEVHGDLLNDNKRWPEALTPWGDPKMRKINSMTRDPYIGHIYACWFLNRKQFIEVLKVRKWWLRRPYFMAWKRYLVDGRSRDLWIFERSIQFLVWWGSKTEKLREKTFNSKYRLVKQLHHRFGINGYSLRLWCLMADASGSWRARVTLMKKIPAWNLFCWMLMNPTLVGIDEIEAYVPQRGFQWGDQEPKPKGWDLPEGDPHPLDKDILYAIRNKHLNIR